MIRPLIRSLIRPVAQAFQSADEIVLIRAGYINPALTFSRASGATYIDGAGVIQTVGNDVPRYPNGLGRLLIEGARTNIALSSDQVVSPWGFAAAATGVLPVAVLNTATAPDGTLTADLVTFNRSDTTGRSMIFQTITTTGAQYPASLWIKANSGADVGKTIQLLQFNGSANINVTDVTLTAAWVRVAIPSPAATLAGATQPIRFGYEGALGLGTGQVQCLIWGTQVELGAFSSSYMVTTTAAVTRAADNLSVLLASLGMPATGFTLSGRCLLPQVAAFQTIFQADAAADANRYCLFNQTGTSNIQGLRTTAGSQVNGTATGAMAAGTTFGWAMSINLAAGTASYCMQSGSVQTLAGGPTSGITTLRFGNVAGSGAGAMFGSISASARPYTVPDAALPSLAAGAL